VSDPAGQLAQDAKPFLLNELRLHDVQLVNLIGQALVGVLELPGLLLDVGQPTMCLQSPPEELLGAAVGDFDRDGDDEWVYANSGTIWLRDPG